MVRAREGVVASRCYTAYATGRTGPFGGHVSLPPLSLARSFQSSRHQSSRHQSSRHHSIQHRGGGRNSKELHGGSLHSADDASLPCSTASMHPQRPVASARCRRHSRPVPLSHSLTISRSTQQQHLRSKGCWSLSSPPLCSMLLPLCNHASDVHETALAAALSGPSVIAIMGPRQSDSQSCTPHLFCVMHVCFL